MSRVIVALIVGLMLRVVSRPADAALVTWEFEATVVNSGVYDGTTGFGSISYDDSLLTGVGSEEIDVLGGLVVEFTIFSQLFTEQDDVDSPSYPVLSFFDGTILDLDYIVSETGSNPVAIYEPGVGRIDFFNNFTFDTASNKLLVNIEIGEGDAGPVVPEPASALLMAIGGLGLGVSVRRRKV